MDIKIGAIVIGSLLWDLTEIRKKWQNELSLDNKLRVPLPIRYGRLSEKSREGTYSMVFSNGGYYGRTMPLIMVKQCHSKRYAII